jgi:BASS family bile acid:Na+ symporter
MAAFLAAFLPVAMMVLMFSLGLRLRLGELLAELRAPRALGLGLGAQMLGLPLLAFAIARALGLDPLLTAGLMLVAASPGGVTSNYAAHLARGSVGLSVAMTLVTSLLAPLTLPLVLVAAGVAAPDPAGLWKISLGMSAVAVAPMALGMALARYLPRLATPLGRWIDPLAKLLFLAMVVATFVQNWGAMQGAVSAVGGAVLLLAVLGPVLALGLARLGRLDGMRARTVMTEAALQNVAITIFVAGKLLGQPELSIPGLIYAVLMNLVALLIIGSAGLGARRAALARQGL